MDRPSTDPATERRIANRYRLQSVLGRGGMGVVWAAHDEVLGRAVAVKEVLPVPGLSEDQLVAMRHRTLHEARTAARLSSSAALLVYDVVEQAGEPWIVMERLSPRTLADVLDERGRLTPDEVATLGLTLLDALDAAHRVGVLHRDVKPSNVMFRSGQGLTSPVLTDFGIARFAGDPTATVTGTVIGSPAFLAPERARGDKATPASDLWALGITLWIAAEGTSPFHREGTLPTLTAVLTADLPDVEYAGRLAPVLTGLLRKDPSQRLDSRRVRALLERALTHGAAPAPAGDHTAALPTVPAEPTPQPVAHREPRPAPLPVVGPPTRRRSPRGVLAGVLGALLVLGLVSVALITGGRDEPQAGEAGTATAPITNGSPSAAPSEPSGASASTSSTPSPTTTSTPTPTPASSAATSDAGSVPAGMRRYTDRTGFSVAVPADWTAERRNGRVYLRDPGSSAYLLVDQTRKPALDPVADWQTQEKSVSRRLPGYNLIRIDANTVRGWRGADWEFTHGSGTHVLNRNLVTAPDQAYALYWSAPERTWERSRSDFEQVTASFQPRG